MFKWKPGDSSWKDTGLADTDDPSEGDLADGFRLAVPGETVYAGKRNGRLFQSLDDGNSWKDITPNLPLRFTCFKEIAFAGSTVYVATDAGVLNISVLRKLGKPLFKTHRFGYGGLRVGVQYLQRLQGRHPRVRDAFPIASSTRLLQLLKTQR